MQFWVRVRTVSPQERLLLRAHHRSAPEFQGTLWNATARRSMSIHEYQSMDILEKHGIPTAGGRVATSVEQAYKVAESLSNGPRSITLAYPVIVHFGVETDDLVVKAQVLAGGRGKGVFDNGLCSGVQLVESPEEARQVAQTMLGHRLITKQTGNAGRPCNAVFIVPRLFSRKDYYVAILLDRQNKGMTLMGSSRGGMDIETVAKEEPNAIITQPIPINAQLGDKDLQSFAKKIGISPKNVGEMAGIIKKMVELVKEKDLTLLEINPLVETNKGKLVCLDAKLNFDDNADFRQKEVFSLRDETQEDPREVRASAHKLNYIGLDGQIGCLVNGAGLAMATMDIIKMHGGEPANFLDVGGSATSEQVEEAIGILGEDPSVKAILVNIFGGIMRCDVIAQGITNAAGKKDLKIPIVVRLLGTNMKEAKEIIAKSKMKVFACDDLEEASKKAVLLSKIVELAKAANVEVSLVQK